MRIAFGLDGVFADLDRGLGNLSTQVFETALPGASRAQQRLLWRVVLATENFWEHLDEIEPGAIAKLASIAGNRRWEVIFLVRRAPTVGSTAQIQSQKWLVAKGFDRPSVYVVDRPFAEIVPALNLDVVVDSPFEHRLEEADGSHADCPAEQATPQRPVTSIGSVDQCLRQLCDLEDEGKRWSRRLMRIIIRALPRSPDMTATAADGADALSRLRPQLVSAG